MTSHGEPAVPALELPTDTSAADASTGEGPRAAARLLEVAAHNAEELLTEATAEAKHLVEAAREEADQLVTAARAEAQKVRTELEETKAELSAEIARLRDLEQVHRDRMRSHLTDLLAQTEAYRPS